MAIFILSVSAGVSFEGAFSLSVSLTLKTFSRRSFKYPRMTVSIVQLIPMFPNLRKCATCDIISSFTRLKKAWLCAQILCHDFLIALTNTTSSPLHQQNASKALQTRN